LRKEEIEFFVADTRDIAPDPDLLVTPLCRQHGPFMCRKGHPLLAVQTARPSDMIAYGFATLLVPTVIKQLLRKIVGLAADAPLPIVLECDNVAAIKDLTLADDVILLATEAAATEEISSGRLQPLHFKNLPPMYAEIGIVQLAGRTLSPGARLVIEYLQAVTATLPATDIYRDGSYVRAA
jgi:DNA-binding transcriptional LysR family regulator